MKYKPLFILAALFGGIAIGILGYNLGMQQGIQKNINSYDECVANGYPVMESSPEQCSTPDGKHFTNMVSQYVTFEGKVICLPHKDMDGPHTLECAIGLQTAEGKNYALQSSNELASAAGSDKQVRVTGTLKTDQNSKYKIEGTISVTDFAFTGQ